MPETLHTRRLALEPWSAEAARLLRTLATTPAVVRYIGDGMLWSDSQVEAAAARMAEHWRDHGFGWRLARLAPSGDAVGLIALNFAGPDSGVDPGEYEIGWWLAPAAWGQGIAREGAAALRQEAFERLSAPSILARIQPGNAASLAVARAIGLRDDGHTTGRTGERISLLRLTATAWRALPRSAPPRAPA